MAFWQIAAFAGMVELRAEPDAVVATIVISVPDQQLAAVVGNQVAAMYPVSTSKFGVGDASGSYKTPLGLLRITNKIGGGLPLGSVIKNRSATGEIVAPNAPGRDAIVSRILWLEGQEPGNCNAGVRGIYIHGTPEEYRLGQQVSWGCIRMRSRDIAQLFEVVREGTPVEIVDVPLVAASLKSLAGARCPVVRRDLDSASARSAPWPRYRLCINSNSPAIPATFLDIRWSAGISGWSAGGLRFKVGGPASSATYPNVE